MILISIMKYQLLQKIQNQISQNSLIISLTVANGPHSSQMSEESNLKYK